MGFLLPVGVDEVLLPFLEIVDRISSNEVKALYEEARDCIKVNAYTATILCCRKLLMNIAVVQGAEPQSFRTSSFGTSTSSPTFGRRASSGSRQLLTISLKTPGLEVFL